VIGLPGSGKTEVINCLMEKLSCPKVYFGDVIFDEMKLKNLEINEANERQTREKLREHYGMSAMAIKSLPKIKKLFADNDTVLVESLYGWEEYLVLEKEFSDQIKLLAVYSSPDVRHARLKNRPKRPLTREEAISRDQAQIVNLDQARPIVLANYTVVNEDTLETLREQVGKILTKF